MSSAYTRGLFEKQIMRAGELPLEIMRMKAKGYEVILCGQDKWFTLPSNISELGDITNLDLSRCSLRGLGAPGIPRAEAN